MSSYPDVYQRDNESLTKFLNVVVQIEDSPYLFGLVDTYTKIRYGDPGVKYGDGYVYGGYRKLENVKPYLSVESNLKLSQKIEPEMGKGSASTLTLVFVDVDGFMTKFISPGQILNEPLGGKQVKVWLGYAKGSSFPEDYFVVFRGYITATKSVATKVTLELTDANFKTKQQSCYLSKSNINSIVKAYVPGDVNTGTDTFNISAHTFVNGYIVNFGPSPPLPLDPDASYYIVNATTNTFQVSSTLNGAAINLLSQGSGAQAATLVNVGTFATTIPVVDTTGFMIPITGPDGSFDTSSGTFLFIDDESMQYVSPSQVSPTSVIVSRGARGTTAANHEVGADIQNQFQITGNIMDNALKLMLSGWGGPWKTGVSIRAFGITDDPEIGVLQKGIALPDGVNAVEDYGQAVGDYLYVTGTGVNDGTYTVSGFLDARGYPNNIILVNQFVTPQATPPGSMALRSQYDTLPVNCGTKLRPLDVDVANWQRTKRLFAFQPDSTFRNVINDPISCKDFIEAEYMKPAGMYLITRFGRISVSATKPPLAGEILVILNKDSVIEPQNIQVVRSTTTRRFFNEVQYYYDTNDAGDQTSVDAIIDSQSLSDTTISSVLPINANGLKTDLGAASFIKRRGGYILARYKNAAIEITVKTNWKAGSLIQVSDTVALYDEGGLQISNLATGTRDLGAQLYEVINWDLDIKTGTSNLTLLQQLGYQVTDRFAGIAPSSVIDIGSTTNRIPLLISYGGRYPNQEYKKYTPIIGDLIAVHSPDFSFYEEVTLIGFDTVKPNTAIVSSLSIAPPAGYIFECAVYPNGTNPKVQQKTKLLFSFIDPTLIVTSGTSTTVFDVSAPDAAKIPSNAVVQIHNADFSRESSQVSVLTVVGTTVTLKTPIEFVPQPGDYCELVGFLDGGGAYLIL